MFSRIGVAEISIAEHPCYSASASHKFARMHLSVAPRCNISCKYCRRDFNCINESRPGVCSKILSPVEALRKTEEVISRYPNIKVIGIAGPGEPLANHETFETFRLLHSKFPRMIKCLSTNGLLLPEKIEALCESGVKALTVTVNAATPSTGSKIYSFIHYQRGLHCGSEASAILLANQYEGVRAAVKRGIAVKINSVFIPTINDGELLEIAEKAKAIGVNRMNIIPLIPLAEFSHFKPPTEEELHRAQTICGKVIKIFRHCQRCRADAVGLITEKTGLPLPEPVSATI